MMILINSLKILRSICMKICSKIIINNNNHYQISININKTIPIILKNKQNMKKSK